VSEGTRVQKTVTNRNNVEDDRCVANPASSQESRKKRNWKEVFQGNQLIQMTDCLT
jgi:hypothetical protein